MLRNEARRRPVVVVGVADPVRVELDIAVVEVEVRRVVEANIRLRIFAFARPRHRSSKAILAGNEALISLLNFIQRHQPYRHSGPP